VNTILPSENPAAPSEKIIELRELLAQKYPQPVLRVPPACSTGVMVLDRALQGGLWQGGMVELVGEQRSSGAASVLRGILEGPARREGWAALIDGSDGFSPETIERRALARFLWLRCHSAAEAMQCADLLLRDGNLPLVFLDLRGNAPAELRKIASQSWYRLQRMLEPTAIAFLALTPFPLIPCADARVGLQGQLGLKSLEDEAELWRSLELRVLRNRRMETQPETPIWAAVG
jgi:hypothetical protein